MAGSSFDTQRIEPSRELLMGSPPLDAQRAESCQQHVRALNTQFSSWVQSQLQNHPDELWEDGVQDYLLHSSNIMKKFVDVVNWLKENSGKRECFSAVACHTDDKIIVPSESNNERKLFQKEITSPPTATFSNSWNSGIFFNSESPVLFGGQNSVPINNDSNIANDDNDDDHPSSPSVKKSEEKGVVIVHEVKCKLYVKATDPAEKDPWKDRGTGHFFIKCKEGFSKGTLESKPTAVVRNDAGKVLLNALLYPGIKTSAQKNSLVTIFHTLGDDGGTSVAARTFLIRMKSEDDRNKLGEAIQEYAPKT